MHMLAVYIYGCLIPAAIRIVQNFSHQLLATLVAIFVLRLVLVNYVKIMSARTKGPASPLLES